MFANVKMYGKLRINKNKIMIAKEKYLEAIKIVEDYREQLRIANVVRSKRLKEEQLKREEECGEHYYIQNGKWQSGMRCQDCGKTID